MVVMKQSYHLQLFSPLTARASAFYSASTSSFPTDAISDSFNNDAWCFYPFIATFNSRGFLQNRLVAAYVSGASLGTLLRNR